MMESSLLSLTKRIADLDDDTGFVSCTAIEICPNDISIYLEFYEFEEEIQHWHILAKGVTAHRIRRTQDFCWPRLETDHPILMPHHLPHKVLYFNSSAKNSDEVFAQLLTAQIATTGSWFPSDFFLFTSGYQTIQDFLRIGFGQLAVGPEPVIEAFQVVLTSHGIEHSTLSWDYFGWNGSSHFLLNPAASALVAQGSYIVADKFIAQKVEHPSSIPPKP